MIHKKSYSIIEFKVSGNNQINTILKKNFSKYNKESLESQYKLETTSQLEKTTNSKNQSGDSVVLSIKIRIDLKTDDTPFCNVKSTGMQLQVLKVI